jgi:Flp pilus assembly protein TadG
MATASLFRRFRHPCLSLGESGVAAVEFAMILPIMVTLWLGGVEVTGALSVDRRLNAFASTMGDLVARTKTITEAQVTDIFQLAEAAMFPYSEAGISMRITAITMDEDGNAKVSWSRDGSEAFVGAGDALPAYEAGDDVNSSVPEALRGEGTEDTQLIMAEAQHTYHPVVGYVITGDLDLDDRMFFVPRLVAQVKICATTDVDTCVVTDEED